MSSQKKLHLPPFPSDVAMNRSKKECLKKDVLMMLQDKGLGWTTFSLPSVGENFVNTLTNSLWYLDGHYRALEDRFCHVPSIFKLFEGYNTPEKSKHRRKDAANLSAAILDSYSTTLNQLLLHPCFDHEKWKLMKKSVGDLAECMTKYALYLHRQNLVMQKNHSALSVIRSVSDCESICIVQASVWTKPEVATKYKTLIDELSKKCFFEPVLVNDFAPINARYYSHFVQLVT